MILEHLNDILLTHHAIDPAEGRQMCKTAQARREQMGSAEIKLAAVLAKTAFQVAGDRGFEFQLFRGLEAAPTETPENRKVACLVFRCLGRLSFQDRLAKQAGAGLSLFQALRGAGGAAIPLMGETGKLMALAGALGGASAAGAGWGINRALTKEEKKLQELEIQRDTYGRLAAEVRDELKRRRLSPTPQNVASAVKYLT
jgi:hypothetical protein